MSDVHRVYCGIHEGERCDCRPCAPASGEPLTDAAKLAMFDTAYARCVRAEAALREIRQGALDAMNDAQSTHHESLGDIAAIAGRALSGARPGEGTT